MSRTYNFRRNITLYHGTLKALLPGIMEKGLRPRGKAKKALRAMGASVFAPTTQEWFDYHFAGERLDAIRQIISPKQMQKAKNWPRASGSTTTRSTAMCGRNFWALLHRLRPATQRS
jgi:hypothetical protein